MTKSLNIYYDTYFSNHTNIPLYVMSVNMKNQSFVDKIPKNTEFEMKQTKSIGSSSSSSQMLESLGNIGSCYLEPGETKEFNWKKGIEEGLISVSSDAMDGGWSQVFKLNREKEGKF